MGFPYYKNYQMKKLNNVDFVYFDTETTKLKNKKGELVSFPYLMGFTIGDGIFIPVWCADIEDIFLKKLEELLINSKTKSITLSGFNVYYDVSVILPFFQNRWNGEINLHLDHKKSFLFGDYKLYLNGIQYTIIIEDYWIFNRNMSLDAWSHHLGEPGKIEFDYDKWGEVKYSEDKKTLIYRNYKGVLTTTSFENELRYLKNDVLMLPKIKDYIELFRKTIITATGVNTKLAKILKIKPGLTAASFSKYVSGLKILANFDGIFRPIIGIGGYKFMERSFMGGYTVGNKNRLLVDCGEEYNIYGYDVNSMYPAIIAEGIPEGRLLKKRARVDDIEWVVITTLNPTLKEKYNFLSDLPTKKELNDGKPWLCSKRLYKALCEVYETPPKATRWWYSKKFWHISTMVTNLYNKRKEKTTDEITAYSIKILLNSLYGKTCEKAHVKHYEITNEGLKKVIDESPEYRSLLAGIYITNQARAILLEGIIKSVKDGNDFLYADTDSIIFHKYKPTTLDIGPGLGQWKLEGEYNFFSRPGVKKKYLLEGKDSKGNLGIKVAVSGFNRHLVLEIMTQEQRRLLFNNEVNILWRRAKTHSKLNSLNQIIIDAIDVETNESIPITHELINEDGQFTLKKYHEF